MCSAHIIDDIVVYCIQLRKLLEAGASASSEALAWAAVGGHELIVTELLARGGPSIALVSAMTSVTQSHIAYARTLKLQYSL
jgi:hypothetical protein